MGRIRNNSARNLCVEDIGVGIENTKTRAQLCEETGLGDSQMRIQLQNLKKNGTIICSSCHREGYFIPRADRPEEVEIAKADYAERKKKAYAMLEQNKFLEAFIESSKKVKPQPDLPYER